MGFGDLWTPAGMLSTDLALTPEGAFDPKRPVDPRSSMALNMLYQAGMLPFRAMEAARDYVPGDYRRDLPRAATTDVAAPQADPSTMFGRLGIAPVAAKPGDELVGTAMDTAMTAGLGASPAAELGAVGAFGGRAAYNPLLDREAMSVAQERAIARRGAGLPTGKSAAGWDVKRPDPTGFARDVAEARAGFKADAGDAAADYLRDTNPNLTPDDVAHLEEMARVPSQIGTQKGFTLGSGATDKRMAAAEAMIAAHDPRLQQAYRDEMGSEAGDAAYKAYLALHGEPHVAKTASPEPAAAGASESAAAAPGRDVAGGAGGGAGGLEQAQAAAARWAGAAKPLEGLPQKAMLINGEHFVPGPIGSIRQVAEDYMRSTGRPYEPPTKYHRLDPEHSTAIARAFEDMPHTPDDPATKASYAALAKETLAQYEAMKKTGLKVEFIKPDMADPYAANPRLAAKDVAENNHLWVFPTDQGFGSAGPMGGAHPMLQPTGETISGKPTVLNDIFRAVHDYYGHLKEGHGFRAGGEDNAWRSHAAMYSDIARPAMTTETRGQNSWVNYGPHGEANRKASAADTVYADQKVGLMPEWTMRDRGSPDPILAYHGSPHSFEKFDINKMGAGEGNQAYGPGMYFAENPDVANWYRHQLMARRDPLLQKYGLDSEDGANIGIDLGAHKGDVSKVSEAYHYRLDEERQQRAKGDRSAATRNAIKRLEGKIAYLQDPERAVGHEYQVRIMAQPHEFLDWEKPLSEQSPEVQRRLAEAGLSAPKPKITEIKDPTIRSIVQHALRETDGNARQIDLVIDNDSSLYNAAVRHAKRNGRDLGAEDERASSYVYQQAKSYIDKLYKSQNMTGEKLVEGMKSGLAPAGAAVRASGIKGVRYRDQLSRIPGSVGTSNYVVFDPKIVEIIRKYGLAGMLGGGAAFGALGRPQEQQ